MHKVRVITYNALRHSYTVNKNGKSITSFSAHDVLRREREPFYTCAIDITVV